MTHSRRLLRIQQSRRYWSEVVLDSSAATSSRSSSPTDRNVVALNSFIDNHSLDIKGKNVVTARAADGTYDFVEGDIRDERLIEEHVA